MTTEHPNPKKHISYWHGVLNGLWRFAWMKDGTYYVGTCGTTLREAKEQVFNEAARYGFSRANLDEE